MFRSPEPSPTVSPSVAGRNKKLHLNPPQHSVNSNSTFVNSIRWDFLLWSGTSFEPGTYTLEFTGMFRCTYFLGRFVIFFTFYRLPRFGRKPLSTKLEPARATLAWPALCGQRTARPQGPCVISPQRLASCIPRSTWESTLRAPSPAGR